MELSYFLCIMPLTLTAVAVFFASPTEAYESSSFHHAVPGQFNHSYELNVSRTASVSILYNQSYHEVTMLFVTSPSVFLNH